MTIPPDVIDWLIRFKHSQLDTFFGLPFKYQVIGKAIPLLGLVLTIALVRDLPKMRKQPIPWLRFSRYWFCVSGMMILGDYTDDGYAKSFFIMNFFFAAWGMVLCNMRAHRALPDVHEKP